jgi:hypothetical protein
LDGRGRRRRLTTGRLGLDLGQVVDEIYATAGATRESGTELVSAAGAEHVEKLPEP